LFRSYIHINTKLSFWLTASKEDLIPPVPILTRYSREAGIIKAFVKKELFDTRVLEREETRPRDISVLTTPILCVQLNTLYVSYEDVSLSLYIFTEHLCCLSFLYLDWNISLPVKCFYFLYIFILTFDIFE
jgi:hypothetical protein